DTRTGKAVGEPMPQPGPAWLMRYSPNNKVLAVGGVDGRVRLWGAERGWALGPPLLHPSLPGALALPADGLAPLSGTQGGTVRSWPVPRPVRDDPVRFQTWLHARGGVRLVGEETVQLSPEEWQKECRALAQRWPGDDPALDGPVDDRAAWHRERA